MATFARPRRLLRLWLHVAQNDEPTIVNSLRLIASVINFPVHFLGDF
jgi:hypothetical protein